MPLKYFLITIILFIGIHTCIAGVSNAQSIQVRQDKYGIFTPVKNAGVNERISIALNLYRDSCRALPVAKAMLSLDQLEKLAIDMHDKYLQCAIFDLRADYYSVKYGYNLKSTAYYLKAIHFSAANKMIADNGMYLHRIAIYYSVYKKNTLAIKYILKALDVFKKVGYEHVPEMEIYFFQTARFYYNLGDFDNARDYALQSLKHNKIKKRLTINALNTVGLAYRNTRDFDKAISYFNQSLKLAINLKDTVWVGIAKGNIGSVYFMQNKYDKAWPYIVTDYTTSIKYGEKYNAAIALLRLIAINLSRGNYEIALQQLKTAESVNGKILGNYFKYKAELYRLESEYYEKNNNYVKALTYRKKFEAIKDSVDDRNNFEAVERVKLQWEQDKYAERITQLKARAAALATRRNVIVAFIILIAVIVWLVYNSKLLRAKAEGEMLKAQKSQVDHELKNAADDLLKYTKSIEEKNSIINKFRKEIEQLNVQFADAEKVEQLNHLLQARLMTDASWSEFKRLFTRVYPGFLVRVKQQYPIVNETDMRLLALIKLNLNNRTMAGMLGITAEGVKKARQRLRKKMALCSNDSIENSVLSI